MHMIMAASLVCQKRRGAEVDVEDITRVFGLFVDVKRSTQFLLEYQREFMFDELEQDRQDEEDEEDDDDEDDDDDDDEAAALAAAGGAIPAAAMGAAAQTPMDAGDASAGGK